jgi:hypothetical protein
MEKKKKQQKSKAVTFENEVVCLPEVVESPRILTEFEKYPAAWDICENIYRVSALIIFNGVTGTSPALRI